MKVSSRLAYISHNLLNVRQEIRAACDEAQRTYDDVSLIAVSKGQDIHKIKQAYDSGQRDFGESYAKEMAEKMAKASQLGLNQIRWHFIGAIQSNKINIIKDAHVVHSVCSVRHGELLNKAAIKNIEIFLQVNLNGDANRHGALPSDAPAIINRLKSYSMLDVKGLMAILPLDSPHSNEYWFHHMMKLKQDILAAGLLTCDSLSMGMSDDFREAIAQGSNFLRIGTRIFGPRGQ